MIGGSARAALLRRCQERCESCGLEWPWAPYAFLVDAKQPARTENLVALCLPCSAGRGDGVPLLSRPSLRDRMRAANNRRTGAKPLTPRLRRELIAARGGRCEICGATAEQRQLDVHHRTGILRGGDESPANLMVLCFACHHHLRACAEGCGRWAKRPASICRSCRERLLLAEVRGGAS